MAEPNVKHTGKKGPATCPECIGAVVRGRSCEGYRAVLYRVVDVTKPIVPVAIDHMARTVTLGNA